MNRKVVKIIICLLVAQFSFIANAASRQKDGIEVPVEIKPDRMKMLEEMANRQVIIKTLPSTEESASDLKNMLEQRDDYINIKPTKIEKISRILEVPVGVNDGKFEVVYFSPNLITTLVFVDKLGNPWTIQKHSVSTPSKVQPELVNANMMTFSPKVTRGEGNITLFFKDSNYPITLEWKISNEKIDYITEVKIDGYGDESPQDNMLRMYIGGKNVTPKYQNDNNSKMISGNTPLGFSLKKGVNEFGEEEEGFKFWVSDDGLYLYVRTTHDVMYPPKISRSYSADRLTKVYRSKYKSRVSVRKNGKVINLKLN